jgi:hypothetical protein
MKFFVFCAFLLLSLVCKASEGNGSSFSIVNGGGVADNNYSYRYGGYLINTKKDISAYANDIFPDSVKFNTQEDIFSYIGRKAKALGLGDIPFEVVNDMAFRNAEVTPSLVNYNITNQLFQESYTLKRGGEASVEPNGIYYNGNGVTTVVNVKSGAVSVDLMKGTRFWVQTALVNKNYTSASASTGYPGFYGARVTCISKAKCKFIMSTFILN